MFMEPYIKKGGSLTWEEKNVKSGQNSEIARNCMGPKVSSDHALLRAPEGGDNSWSGN
jgi:hypothetical protein